MVIDELKITIYLKEYSLLKAELRQGLAVVFGLVSLAIVIWASMLMLAFLSDTLILLLFAPAISLFFTLIAGSIFSYLLNLGNRLSEIEENINIMIGEDLLTWEKKAGAFFSDRRRCSCDPNIYVYC
tara:strand:- start:36 stop:416 length:381 start_codon:yes stop_codon:yes gene_type:complete